MSETRPNERAKAQVEFACENIFPDEPLSISDVELHLSNADELDYVMYSTPDKNDELILLANSNSIHIEYHMGEWLATHNSSARWSSHSNCDAATELADFFSKLGWSSLMLTNTDKEI